MSFLLPEIAVTRNSIHHMSAFRLLNALPDNSVDMIFCDPPYGHNNNNGDLIHRREVALGQKVVDIEELKRPIQNDGEEANTIFKDILPDMFRVLKPGGCCCCCCCGGGGPDPQFARWSLWMDEIFEFKQMVVWDKGPMGMGWHYRRSYETVLVAMKPGKKCAWYDDSHKIENIIRPDMGIKKIIPRSLDHPTPKPIELPEHFIKLHSQPNDLIVDPFMGGGSTLIATKNLGRNYIGCDIDRQWVDYCNNRLGKILTFQPSIKKNGMKQLSLFG